jgi:hypothetical protein
MLKNMEEREARQEEMRERMQTPREVPFDEHFTVLELAGIWKLSRQTVRRIVENEPGVVRLGEDRPGVRRHQTLRVPASVARRIYLRLIGEEPAEKTPPTRFRPSLIRRRQA